MSTDVGGKKKLPVTTILVAIALALLLLACGGGGLYLDYHAGSFSSTFLPAEGAKPMVPLDVNDRGLLSNGHAAVGYNATTGSATVVVGETELEVSRDQVMQDGKVIAEFPPATAAIEISSYRGTTKIIADGKTLATAD